MSYVKAGIKYCGGCNPRIKRKKIIEQLKEGLSEVVDFTLYSPMEKIDLLIVVNGCHVGCGFKFDPEKDCEVINIRGSILEGRYLEEEDLIERIKSQILTYIEEVNN